MEIELTDILDYARLLSRDYHCVNKKCIKIVPGVRVIYTVRPRFPKLRRVK